MAARQLETYKFVHSLLSYNRQSSAKSGGQDRRLLNILNAMDDVTKENQETFTDLLNQFNEAKPHNGHLDVTRVAKLISSDGIIHYKRLVALLSFCRFLCMRSEEHKEEMVAQLSEDISQYLVSAHRDRIERNGWDGFNEIFNEGKITHLWFLAGLIVGAVLFISVVSLRSRSSSLT